MLPRVSIVCLLFCLGVAPVATPLAQKGHADDMITELPLPELFLQPMKYIGHSGTTVVYLRTEQVYCVNNNGNPLSPCLVVPYTTDPFGPWSEIDLFRVVIPRKTLRAALATSPRFGPSFNLTNHTPDENQGRFQARLVSIMESPVLPGGSIAGSFGDRVVSVPLAPGRQFEDQIHYTRDGMVGRSWLRGAAGLSERDIDAFFDNDISITVRLRVRGALLSYGSVYVGMLYKGY